jgi:hypothetical protein
MRRTTVNTMTGMLLGLATLVPNSALAAEGNEDPKTRLDELVIYAVDQDTNELVRHKLANDYTTRIGTIRDQDGVLVTDVDALANVTTGDHKSLYGAANYDGADTAHLAKINVFDGTAMVTDTGLAEITGMVAARGTGASPVEDFDISSNMVVPGADYAVKLTVLGCALSYAGYYDMPVKLRVTIDGSTYDPFGSYTTALGGGNVNDGSPHQWIAPATFDAGSSISVKARAYKKYSTSYSGTSESHWFLYEEVGSATQPGYVMVLRDGDPVPPVEGFLDQDDLVDFVAPYVDTATDTMKLGDNQAIFCFELGGAALSDPSVDFQDCVVLVTLADDPSYFFGAGEWVLLATARPEVGNDDEQLVIIDPATGAWMSLMDLNGQYDGLALAADGTLLAVEDNELWQIDPVAGTESQIGQQGLAGDVTALEYAFGVGDPRILVTPDIPASWTLEGALFGFSAANDTLLVMGPDSGQAREVPTSFSAINAKGIVFVPEQLDSWGVIIADAHD